MDLTHFVLVGFFLLIALVFCQEFLGGLSEKKSLISNPPRL